MSKIKKAIIPAAGLGTRLRPLTYGVPKELLIIRNKPLIHYSIDECVSAGVKSIAVVINKEKDGVKEYLENVFNDMVNFDFIYQEEATGIADAVLLADDFVGKDPFFILSPDVIFQGEQNPLIELDKCYNTYKAPCVALISSRGPDHQIGASYGFIKYDYCNENVVRINRLYGKGSKKRSIYKTTGRAIWNSSVLDYLRNSRIKDSLGEYSEVPSLQKYIEENEFYGVKLLSTAYDCGTFDGFKFAAFHYSEETKDDITITNRNIDISVVIPIYNEEENLHELYRRLSAVMERLCAAETTEYRIKTRKSRIQNNRIVQNHAIMTNPRDLTFVCYEIIMVNDGSTDSSWEIIKELHEKNPGLKGINFSRNFGHHIAISAGLDYAKGEAVILMDGDLQDPPEEIPRLYEKFKEGYYLVYGIRKERQDNYYRKISSYIFWKTIKGLSGFDIPENQSMLRIMNRKYVNNLKKITERNRFLAGIFAWAGFDQASIPIEHAPRFAGKSKYNFWKMIKLTFNAITSFSYFPLQVSGFAGLFISITSISFGIWLILRKLFFGIEVAGWASTMVAILFVGGFNLAVLWLLGEYVGRVFTEVQRRPLYIIEEDTYD